MLSQNQVIVLAIGTAVIAISLMIALALSGAGIL